MILEACDSILHFGVKIGLSKKFYRNSSNLSLW